jgi:hypothetical protein
MFALGVALFELLVVVVVKVLVWSVVLLRYLESHPRHHQSSLRHLLSMVAVALELSVVLLRYLESHPRHHQSFLRHLLLMVVVAEELLLSSDLVWKIVMGCTRNPMDCMSSSGRS